MIQHMNTLNKFIIYIVFTRVVHLYRIFLCSIVDMHLDIEIISDITLLAFSFGNNFQNIKKHSFWVLCAGVQKLHAS